MILSAMRATQHQASGGPARPKRPHCQAAAVPGAYLWLALVALVHSVSADGSDRVGLPAELPPEGFREDDACAKGAEGACGLQMLQRRAAGRAQGAAAAEQSHLSGTGDGLSRGARSISQDLEGSQPDGGRLEAWFRDHHLRLGRRPHAKLYGEKRASVLAGSSVYFVVLDRFARADGNSTMCNDDKNWCGGTLRGLIKKLDYIADLGFDCLWITPVVKQFDGETKDGTGFMGYWAKNFYEIDPHYGTSQDLHDLVDELHKRNMAIMLDIVANHVGPVHSTRDLEGVYPFNSTSHYHTLAIGDLTFDQYTVEGWKKSVNRPVQAMWSGAQCPGHVDCNCYRCEPVKPEDINSLPPPSWDACPFGKMVWNPYSSCPGNSLSAFCMPGDYDCRGYSETATEQGWFYDLGDLNQSVPFVRQELLKWTRWMVEKYNIDMIRLDTSTFLPFDFISELQETAGVPIIGEATATNMTFHASIQRRHGRPGLDGVLNFPLAYTARAAFCHNWFPQATGNLTFLGIRMMEQAQKGLYQNLNTLGTFVDNHDDQRLDHLCKGDYARKLNAITWAMLSKGVPIIYYGTEEPRLTGVRDSMWNFNFTRGRFWHYIKTLNNLRREFHLGTTNQSVKLFLNHQQLGFTRGRDQRVWVYLNNMESADKVVRYCNNNPQAPRHGYVWSNYFTGREATFDADGCLQAHTNIPVALVQRKEGTVQPGWEDSWVKPTPPPRGPPSIFTYNKLHR